MHQEQFIYNQFRLSDDRTVVYFDYTIQHDGVAHALTESLTFPVTLLETPEQLRSLRALHLALGVSYYKTFLPPVIVQPYAMDDAEAAFWNDIWQHGYGEFLYKNKLPAERLATFAAQDGERYEGQTDYQTSGAYLGIGGGKDSIVAGELLKDLGVPVTGFVLATGEETGQSAAVAQTMQVDLQAVERRLDPKRAELSKQPGAYRGHIPISLIFGLTGAALAIATRATYVVVANEASASIPRATWQDRAVNHQWSKSFDAEQQVQRYIQQSVDSRITYFSAIRQLTSLGVAKLFARFGQYLEVFTSDNFVFRIDPSGRPAGRWGLESPKSLSSYILLAPWMSDADVARTFGMDLLNEASLEPLFLRLTGAEGEPPLDCVGTVDELVLSLNLLAQADRYSDTHLMRLAVEREVVHEDNWQRKLQTELQLQSDQALPAELANTIQGYLQQGLSA